MNLFSSYSYMDERTKEGELMGRRDRRSQKVFSSSLRCQNEKELIMSVQWTDRYDRGNLNCAHEKYWRRDWRNLFPPRFMTLFFRRCQIASLDIFGSHELTLRQEIFKPIQILWPFLVTCNKTTWTLLVWTYRFLFEFLHALIVGNCGWIDDFFPSFFRHEYLRNVDRPNR